MDVARKEPVLPQRNALGQHSEKTRRFIEMTIVRIQFEMPEDKAKELEDIMTEYGVQTKKELFNNALTLLKWALKETKRGNYIASIDEKSGKYRELQMPILSHVAPRTAVAAGS